MTQLDAALPISAPDLPVAAEQRLEPARGGDVGGQDRGIVGGEAELALVAGALGVGELGQAWRGIRSRKASLKLEREQVRIGEIAIIVRVLLGAQRARLALVGVEQAGFLDHVAAILDQVDLAARLMLDHRHDEADRIDVLGLGAGAELTARLADADVDVGAHRALLHIAVAAADIAENRAELADVGACFLRAERMSGFETISIKATPERLRST